jgi:hypothetical protein
LVTSDPLVAKKRGFEEWEEDEIWEED